MAVRLDDETERMSGSDRTWHRPARRPSWLLVALAALAVGGGVVFVGWDDLTARNSRPGLRVEGDDTERGADGDDEVGGSTDETTPVDPLRGGPAHNQIWSLAVADDGTVWAGTDRGLSRFDGQEWTTDTSGGSPGVDSVISVTTTRDGDVWATTEGAGGVSRLDGEDWTRYAGDHGLPRFVTSVAVADDDTVWASSPEALYRFEDDRWVRATTYRGAGRATVTSVAAAADGAVWTTTYEGLARFDGRSWRRYTTADGLASDAIAVAAVAVADDGTVWVGTREGLSRLADGEWTTYTARGGPAGGV